MSEQAIAEPRTYDELLAAIRAQMAKLGIGINQLDEICGLPTGFAAKIFSPSRVRPLGWKHSFLIAPELGLKIVFVESTELLEKRRLPGTPYNGPQARFSNNASRASIGMIKRVVQHLAPLGGKARWRGKSKADRAKHMRRIARRRWRMWRKQQRKAKAA